MVFIFISLGISVNAGIRVSNHEACLVMQATEMKKQGISVDLETELLINQTKMWEIFDKNEYDECIEKRKLKNSQFELVVFLIAILIPGIPLLHLMWYRKLKRENRIQKKKTLFIATSIIAYIIWLIVIVLTFSYNSLTSVL